MNYYLVAATGLKLEPLTFCSELEIEPFSEVLVSIGRKKAVKGFVIDKTQKPSFDTKEIESVLESKLTKFQIDLAKFISFYYTCEIGVCLGLFEPFLKTKIEATDKTYELANLSEQQKNALDFINSNQISVLFGDTGSGKSEIYISAIAEVLNNGKQALLLMPEISLTPQMKVRLEAYFKKGVGIWHSKISATKKKEILRDFFEGKIKLIAGARSALFLPFTNLGLIVVDEEHDDSYKSNSTPLYNARDLSIYMGNKHGIRVILGSATPSVTSFYKFPHFRLKGTFFNSKKSFIFDKNQTSLTKTVIENLNQSLKNNHQAVVFLPTRANFKFIRCSSCFESIKCPNCSVSMSLHKKLNALKCHYCNFTMPIPQSCPNCGGEILEAKKIGTSELVLQLSDILKNTKIAKFDRDEITTQNKLENLLKKFNNHEIDILVGTQMLSKGHDYHNVDLAVILGLDEHLEYADFKAREKTLALAIQVAGRSARSGCGTALIQTTQTEFFEKFINNYDEFIKDELSFRKEFAYPPFARLLRILIVNKSEQKAKEIENQILSKIKNIANIEIIGSGRALIEFLSMKYRRQILLRSSTHHNLIKASKIAASLGATVDMDPVNFT